MSVSRWAPRSPIRRRGVVVATSLLGLAACGEAVTDVAPAPITGSYVAVANASFDFGTGTLGALSLEGLAPMPDLTSLHSDSLIAFSGGHLFGINRRGGDNLQLIDPSTFATLWQRSVGSGSNPQDVEVLAPDRALVTRYDTAELWVVDPSADEAGFKVAAIDLSEYADSDGVPEMDRLARIEGSGVTWVSLQRLDRESGYAATNDALLLAIADDSLEVVEEVVLPSRNPTAMASLGSVLWVVCPASHGTLDGTIERYDTASGTFLPPVVEEQTLGGDVGAVVPGDPAFVVWSDRDFVSHVSVVDPEGGVELHRLVSDLGFSTAIAATDELVFVPDRSRTTPGLRVFDRATFEELDGSPFDTGLPPWDLAIVTQ
jgi:hypothetical protein